MLIQKIMISLKKNAKKQKMKKKKKKKRKQINLI